MGTVKANKVDGTVLDYLPLPSRVKAKIMGKTVVFIPWPELVTSTIVFDLIACWNRDKLEPNSPANALVGQVGI